jgi:hypothetical protein
VDADTADLLEQVTKQQLLVPHLISLPCVVKGFMGYSPHVTRPCGGI